ncbi:unnamed protein product [Caenorhabditis bovis]|uniref:Uncharacterized protein n=1 Tax=Caenorhabditis bovis TaxID=2654633 RepID=A0A8S1EEJ3_9PELO|nr:unnamed protein product [Caenorhabditis bovis]
MEEKEDNSRAGCTMVTASIIVILFVGTIVVIRVLLDSEDENNLPLVQGQTREVLTVILYFMITCALLICCVGSFCVRLISLLFQSISPNFKQTFRKFCNFNMKKNIDYYRNKMKLEDPTFRDVVAEARGVQSAKFENHPQDNYPYEYATRGFEDFDDVRRILPQPPAGRGRSMSIDVSII